MSILFLRLGAGVFLTYDGVTGLLGTAQFISVIKELVGVGAGIFLLAGLCTPVSGTVAAMLELWIAFSGADQLRSALLLATLGAALAMLGPGAWSVDARLFGRKRIDIRGRYGCPPSPLKWNPKTSQSSGRMEPLFGVDRWRTWLQNTRCRALFRFPNVETELMAEQTWNAGIRLNSEASASIHDDGLVVLHVPSGLLFTSNQAGASIWKCLERKLPLDAIAGEISRDYGIDRGTAREDTVRFLAELERNGLAQQGAQ